MPDIVKKTANTEERQLTPLALVLVIDFILQNVFAPKSDILEHTRDNVHHAD